MGNLWILYIVIYALLKGSREGMKKAALKKSSSCEILFFYTLIGFIFTLPFSLSALTIEPIYIVYIFFKALVVCIAWLCAFYALNNISVSLYGIMDLSRMLFSTILAIVVMNEIITANKAIGMCLVIIGLLLANLKKNTDSKGMTFPVLIAALLNCFLNAVSGTMDKVLMQDIESSQLQFWFMLFMTVIYGIVVIIRKERISIKSLKRNYWIPLLSISLVIGDKLLFEANANPASQITLITVIKQSSVIVTTLTGWLIFKEKHILYKIMCALIVLGGIYVALL
ncbi:MAG: EamA family transporter [Clostridia bacterium]|nr:EamA family transporter [Clostridia bacterium]